MNDESKTIADLLKAIDDKTVDRSEVMPMLKSIERNTASNIGAAVGSAVTKALAKRDSSNKPAPPAVVKKQQTTLAKAAKQSIATTKKYERQTATVPESAKSSPVMPGITTPVTTGVKRNSVTNKGAGILPVVDAAVKATAVSVSIPSNKSKPVNQETTATTPVRDVSGKFVSKTPATNGVAEQKQENQNDKLSSILKDAVGSKKETIKDTAGRMALGPFYDVGKELLEAAGAMQDNAKDEKSTAGRLKNWGKGKLGVKEKQPGDAQGKASFKDRLTNRFKALRRPKVAGVATAGAARMATAGGGGEQGGGLFDKAMSAKTLKDMWSSRKGVSVPKTPSVSGTARGGGMMARGAGVVRAGASAASGITSKIGSLAGPLMAGISLPLVAAAGAAAFGVQQFGKALITGKSDVSDFADWLTKKVTGDKTATLSGKVYDGVQGIKNTLGFGPGGSVRDVIGQVESGNKGYGAYQNKDSGVVSYGKYQFTADSGSLGTVLDKYSANGGKDAEKAKQYSSVIKNGSKQQKEALRNDPQFKSMLEGASGEKAMQTAQEQTFDQNYFNPAMARGQKAGINVVRNQKVAGFLADTEVQAGSGGNQNVIGKAGTKLQQQGLDWKTATEEQQMQALVSSRKEYTLSVADSKARKGDTKTAEMLRSTAADGGRIDQVAAKISSAKIDTGTGYQTADAAKAGAAAITAAPGTPEYEAQKAKFIADQQGTPPTTTGTAKKKSKAKTVPAPVKKEEPKPVEEPKPEVTEQTGQKQAAGAATPETVPAPATGTGTATPAEPAKPRAKKSSELRAEREAALTASIAAVPAETIAKETAPVETQQATVPAVSAVQTPEQPAIATATNKPAMTYDEQKTARDKIGSDYWVKEEARRAQSGEAFKSVKEQQAGITAEKDAKLSDIETRRKAVEAKYDAGGLSDEEAGKQQVALDAEGEQVKKEHLSKMGDAISGGFKTVDAQSGQLLSEKDAKTNALDAQIAGTAPGATTVSGQQATVPAVSAVQTPLPQPQVAQAAPPPPVEVPGLEKLAKSQEQQVAQQASSSNTGGGSAGLPNIKTEFDDTMLTLMVYDRV